jgi:hypothetical protein
VMAGVLVHPIMAMAGACALVFLYLGKPKPLFTGGASIVGLIVLATAAFVMPAGEWGRFDAHWLALVENRSPYLFIAHWQLEDWSRAAVTLATLGVGFRVLPNDRARTLSLIALTTVVTGLLLTFVACDLLHLVLLTQLQPWRWQWLGTVVAAVLLPEIVRTLWQNAATEEQTTEQRTTALLLISAWVFGSDAYALFTAMTLSPQQLKQTCDTGAFEYLVTAADLGIDPVAEVSSASGPASKKIRLYRCPAPAAAQTLAAAAT